MPTNTDNLQRYGSKKDKDYASKYCEYFDVSTMLCDLQKIYEFCYALYYNIGPARNGQLIIPYASEEVTPYTNRVQLSLRKEVSKEVVQSYFVKVFSEEPTRIYNKKDKKLENFINHAGVDGQPLSTVVFDAVENIHIGGAVFVLIDGPDNISKLDSENKDKKPFVYLKTIIEMFEYKLNDCFTLEEVSFIDEKRKLKKDGEEVQLYRQWTQTETYLFYVENDEKIIIDEPRQLEFFPIRWFSFRPRKDVTKITPEPPFFQTFWTDYVIYNKCSTAGNVLRATCFPILVLDGITEDIVVSEATFIGTNPNSGGKSKYLSPDPGIYTAAAQDIESAINDLYELHRIDNKSGVKEAKSGIALRFEFNEENEKQLHASLLADAIDSTIIKELYALQTGQTDIEYEVEYRKKFTPEDLAEKIEIINIIFNEIQIGDAGKEKLYKFLWPLLFPKATQEEVDNLVVSDMEAIALKRKKNDIINSGQNFEDEE